MGFRNGSYATIWDVSPVSDVQTKARISISRKNKQTDEYETDFSGFVSFFGTAAAKKAAALKERDRIKIGDCDVRTHYDKAKNVTSARTRQSFRVESIQAQIDLAAHILNIADNAIKHENTDVKGIRETRKRETRKALEWGKLRTGTVGISGTDYEPPIPEHKKVFQEFEAIIYNPDASATDKALEAFAWGARGQFFWDGNKRTSLTLANKILVSAGAGILTITDKHMEQFNVLLLDFYNTGNNKALKEFLYENAIQGMTI